MPRSQKVLFLSRNVKNKKFDFSQRSHGMSGYKDFKGYINDSIGQKFKHEYMLDMMWHRHKLEESWSFKVKEWLANIPRPKELTTFAELFFNDSRVKWDELSYESREAMTHYRMSMPTRGRKLLDLDNKLTDEEKRELLQYCSYNEVLTFFNCVHFISYYDAVNEKAARPYQAIQMMAIVLLVHAFIVALNYRGAIESIDSIDSDSESRESLKPKAK